MNKFLLLFLIYFIQTISAQTVSLGGLEFNSRDYLHDERSSLNLTAHSKILLKENFSISFDIAFRDSKYLGQIFQISSNGFISGLLFNQYSNKDTAFIELIQNQVEKLIVIPFAKKDLIPSKWFRIKTEFNLVEKTVKVLIDDKEYSSEIKTPTIQLYADIIFGRIPHFGADTPQMNIKDIRIYESNILLHQWKLNEIKGNLAHDSENNLTAVSENPNWLLPKHNKWKLITEVGPFPSQKSADHNEVNILYYEKENEVWFIYKDFAYRYSLITKQISKEVFVKTRPHLYSTEVYNPYTGKILSQYLGQGKVSEYNIKNKSWSEVDVKDEYEQHYYGHNFFINPLNGDIMMMNGYGWHLTKNTLQRYDTKIKKWVKIKLNGELFIPRQYSVLILLDSTGKLLMFGGNGNESGKQEYGYRNLYDLFMIDLKNYTSKKIWELKDFNKNIVPLMSSYYNENNGCFYLAMSDISTKDRAKQLYRFNIDEPEYEIVSDSIGGEDINLYDGIIFSKLSNKFYITTRGRKTNQGYYYDLYELNYPPISNAKFVQLAYNERNNSYVLISIIVVLVLSALIGVYWFYKRRKNYKSVLPKYTKYENQQNNLNIKSNSIYVFGDFQVFDKNGIEITKEFSPKLKQLFLLLLTKSYNGVNNGVNVETLSTYLWPELSLEQTKNNRNVSITNLRMILSKLDNVDIKNENHHLGLTIGNNIYCDYYEFNSILKSDDLSNKKISQIKEILSCGELFGGLSYKWLDGQKINFIENVISKLKYAIDNKELDKPSKLALADSILSLDSVNEIGLSLKIKTFIELGDHKLAKTSYELFSKEFFRLYGEKYQKSFADFLN